MWLQIIDDCGTDQRVDTKQGQGIDLGPVA